MGGIYIKGMEMPQTCNECRFAIDNYCYAVVRYKHLSGGGRANWCPLVEIPPHGRLGDLDELHKEAVRRSEKAGTYDSWYNCTDRVISAFDIANYPTIIPAEPPKGETE